MQIVITVLYAVGFFYYNVIVNTMCIECVDNVHSRDNIVNCEHSVNVEHNVTVCTMLMLS